MPYKFVKIVGVFVTFEDTPEYKQSMKMRPACNRVLCSCFGISEEAIERFPHGTDLFILDKEFAIDMRIRLNNGTWLTGQEKALTYRFYNYRTFTIEFYQNRFTKEKGEFFKIASQFYLHGYSDKTGIDFIEWKIIDVLKLIHWLKKSGESALAKRTRPASGSRASFLPIPYDKIPCDFILYDSKLLVAA